LNIGNNCRLRETSKNTEGMKKKKERKKEKAPRLEGIS
jgi:hypothetical protein